MTQDAKKQQEIRRAQLEIDEAKQKEEEEALFRQTDTSAQKASFIQ